MLSVYFLSFAPILFNCFFLGIMFGALNHNVHTRIKSPVIRPIIGLGMIMMFGFVGRNLYDQNEVAYNNIHGRDLEWFVNVLMMCVPSMAGMLFAELGRQKTDNPSPG